VGCAEKYPDELRQRAVRRYREYEPKPVIRKLAEQLGAHPEVLRNWIRQSEADRGDRADRPTTDMIAENRRLKRENAAAPIQNALPTSRAHPHVQDTRES
jgi:transposase